jgi:hypothetical protein
MTVQPSLAALVAEQGGLFRRGQAMLCGVTPRQFRALIKPSGPWARVRYGVYTTRDSWENLDHEGRRLLTDRAALLVCNVLTALSHTSSARLRGLPVYGDDPFTHLTRLGRGLSSRVEAGIKHHRGDLQEVEVDTLGGVRLVSPARTALGIAAELGYHSGLVTADAVVRAGVPRQALIDLAGRLSHHPGAPVMRDVARDADGRAETPIETLGRVLVRRMGIVDVQPQQTIRLRDGREVVVDLISHSLRHVFETDGRLKYVDQRDRSGRLVSADEIVWLEKKREDQLRSLGYGFSRLLWSDVQPAAFARSSARLRQEIHDQSAARRLPPTA